MTQTVETMERVQVRTGLYLLPHGDDEIFVRDGSRATFSKVIRDEDRRRLLTSIIQSATQPVDVAELASKLEVDEADVRTLTDRLEEEGVLERKRHLNSLQVLVIGDGQIGDSLRNIVDDMPEIQVADSVNEVDDMALEAAMTGMGLVIVATDSLRPHLNHEVNAAAHYLRVPVLYCYADGPDVQVGPLVYPGETACYSCFEVQDEGARHLRDEFLIFKDDLGHGRHTARVSGPTAAMAAAWASLVVRDVQTRDMSRLAERVVRVETERFEVASHRVLQMPRCPECSRVRPELQHTFL